MSPWSTFALDTPSDIEKNQNPLQIFTNDRSAWANNSEDRIALAEGKIYSWQLSESVRIRC